MKEVCGSLISVRFYGGGVKITAVTGVNEPPRTYMIPEGAQCGASSSAPLCALLPPCGYTEYLSVLLLPVFNSSTVNL
jgi:hypothetical protein